MVYNIRGLHPLGCNPFARIRVLRIFLLKLEDFSDKINVLLMNLERRFDY